MASKSRPGTVLVQLRNIPRFRILSDLSKRAERESASLLTSAIAAVRQAIAEEPFDPQDNEALAQMALSLTGKGDDLRKSPGSPGLFSPDEKISREEIRGLAFIAHGLRKLHGAPVRPVDWALPEDFITFVLERMQFRSGRLVSDRHGARVRPKGSRPPRKMALVALAEEFRLNQDIRSDRFRAVLRGQLDQVVKVTRHPMESNETDPVYTIQAGVETLMAAKLLGVAALEMEVESPTETEVAPVSMRPANDIDEAKKRVLRFFEAWWYHIPPALEPVAEFARQTSMVDFAMAFKGESTPREINLRQDADIADATRTKVWISRYNAAKMAGASEESAANTANRSAEFRTLNSAWRPLERKAREAEAAGHEIREQVRLLKAHTIQIAQDLSLPTVSVQAAHPLDIWMQANISLSKEEISENFEEFFSQDEVEDVPASISTPRWTFEGPDASPEVGFGNGIVGFAQFPTSNIGGTVEETSESEVGDAEGGGTEQLMETFQGPFDFPGDDHQNVLIMPAGAADGAARSQMPGLDDEIDAPAINITVE